MFSNETYRVITFNNKIWILIASLFLFSQNQIIAQSLEDLDDYEVEEIYQKIEVEDGTLDEDGDEIDFIFVESEMNNGTYEIQLTDGPGDLYQIKGTDFFITFRYYFGYAGYGTDCILKIEGGYYSAATLYKLD